MMSYMGQQKDIIVSGAQQGVYGVCFLAFSCSTEARLWPWRTRGAPGACGANKYAVESVLREV